MLCRCRAWKWKDTFSRKIKREKINWLNEEILRLVGICVCAQLLSHVWLTLCDPMVCSPPGSSFHGISQARILEWVAIPFFRGSSWLRDQTYIAWIGRWILTSVVGGPLSHQGSPIKIILNTQKFVIDFASGKTQNKKEK